MTATFDNVAWWSWLIVALPLAAAVLIGLLGRVLRGRSHWPTILAVAGALAISLVLFAKIPHNGLAANISFYDWITTGSVRTAPVIAAQILVDPLTIVMLLTVTCVSLLVVIYSRGYMRDHHGHPERGYERFFAFMALFVASMCILVLAGNFLVLYVGWELGGLCSYLLIGFY